MNLEDQIKAWIADGLTDEEIAEKLLEIEGAQAEEAKVLAQDIDGFAAKVYKLRQADELKVALAKKKQEQEELKAKADAKKEADAEVDRLIKEKLKSLNIDPSGTFRGCKLKRFDVQQGKMVEGEELVVTEEYKACNDMLRCLYLKDTSAALSISRDIDKENKNLLAQAGVKATMRSDSDTVGGYAIPTEVNAEIQQLTYAQSVMLPHVNRDNIVMEDKIYPIVTTDFNVGYIANQDTAATESNAVISNPTINMERTGLFTRIANQLLQQKGADVVRMLTVGYASARARFLDLHLICGNITGDSDLIDGLVFDANTIKPTAIALSELGLNDLEALEEAIDDEADQSSMFWIANRKVRNRLRRLETTGGQRLFPEAAQGGTFEPLGIPFLLNTKTPSTLDVGGDARTGGTDDVIVLADLSKFVVGISDTMRIDSTDAESFTKDLMTFKMIDRFGMKLLFSNTARALELTN